MKTVDSYIRKQDGVAAVEFALIAPALILLLAGVFDFACYINTAMDLQNASRAAAEFITDGGSVDDVENDVILMSNLGVTAQNESKVTVTTNDVCMCNDGAEISCGTSCGSNNYKREYIEVTLSMNYTAPMSFPGIPASLPLQGFVRLQIK